MGFFDSTQLALARGRGVFYGELYEVDFLTADGFYWDGFGNLAAYSHTYLGAGNVVSRSEIPIGINDEAGQLTLTMSGVSPELLARVRASETEIFGRDITIWGQFFDEALQLSGSRWFLFGGVMDVPTYGWVGAESRSIVIPCEGEWGDRNGAAFAYYSSADQKARYAEDKGCDWVYKYSPGVRRQWPAF